MKVKNLKKIIIAAGIAAASCSLAACGGGDAQEQEATSAAASQEGQTNETEPQETLPETKPANPNETGVVVSASESDDKALSQEGNEKVKELRKQLGNYQNVLAGFAYIGTVESDDDIQPLIDGSKLAASYPFVKEIKNRADDGGKDVFLFVPFDEKAKVTVNNLAPGAEKPRLYTAETGTPFFVLTTDSVDPMLDVVITDSNGVTARFNPIITDGDLPDMDYKTYLAHNIGLDDMAQSPVDDKMLKAVVMTNAPGLAQSGYQLSPDSFGEVTVKGVECLAMDYGPVDKDGVLTVERYFAITRDGTLLFEYDLENETWNDLEIADWRLEDYLKE